MHDSGSPTSSGSEHDNNHHNNLTMSEPDSSIMQDIDSPTSSGSGHFVMEPPPPPEPPPDQTNEEQHRQTGVPFFDTTVSESETKWFAFVDADTGNAVYFNQIMGERTWDKSE